LPNTTALSPLRAGNAKRAAWDLQVQLHRKGVATEPELARHELKTLRVAGEDVLPALGLRRLLELVVRGDRLALVLGLEDEAQVETREVE
jgi:hypothetical protein